MQANFSTIPRRRWVTRGAERLNMAVRSAVEEALYAQYLESVQGTAAAAAKSYSPRNPHTPRRAHAIASNPTQTAAVRGVQQFGSGVSDATALALEGLAMAAMSTQARGRQPDQIQGSADGQSFKQSVNPKDWVPQQPLHSRAESTVLPPYKGLPLHLRGNLH